ncbi:hypothetical protein PIB30_076404 [Stylosanthes scabra]|uniref:Putative plant transposon protein domain-containing protein n=1 Tax=Stylosanthes scabra TaxID=79078 RepID=A0ABU6SRI1_9FABA|nr:hypothetical protein [Stylosanthes scabra]
MNFSERGTVKKGVMEVDSANALMAQLSVINKKLERLEVSAVGTPVSCGLCGGPHDNHNCSLVQDEQSADAQPTSTKGQPTRVPLAINVAPTPHISITLPNFTRDTSLPPSLRNPPSLVADSEDDPRFHTFVRGVMMNFSMDKIKTVMKFEGPLNTKMSYRTRMIEGNQELDTVIRDLCVEGSIWSLGAQNNPLYLKCSDLNPIARSWHELIIHNIMPTTNQSEVTVNRAVLIHCIMSSLRFGLRKS